MLNWIPTRRMTARNHKPLLPADDERLYVVGDIHGRLDLLRILMAKIVADHEAITNDGRKPKLVFLGDYIDRGEQSRDVLEALHLSGDWPVVLKGNHEAAILAFLEEPYANRNWLGYGGLETLRSYGIHLMSADATPSAFRQIADDLADRMGPHVEFLRRMPLFYRSGDVVCAHAGIDPANPEGTDEMALLWGRSTFKECDGVQGIKVVHGHYDTPEPVVTPDRIGLDTGAYHSGRLTAARIDDDVKIIFADSVTDNMRQPKLYEIKDD